MQAILSAARAEFADRGREGATVRAIAGRAKVDPALVVHYFGSKQDLFAAATELPIEPRALAERVLAGDPEGLAERMLTYALSLWAQESTGEALRAILRSALADGAEADRAAAAIHDRVLEPLGAATGKPDGELRAALAFSQGIGMAIARHLLAIPALGGLTDDDILRLVEPNLRRYLVGDLDREPL